MPARHARLRDAQSRVESLDLLLRLDFTVRPERAIRRLKPESLPSSARAPDPVENRRVSGPAGRRDVSKTSQPPWHTQAFSSLCPEPPFPFRNSSRHRSTFASRRPRSTSRSLSKIAVSPCVSTKTNASGARNRVAYNMSAEASLEATISLARFTRPHFAQPQPSCLTLFRNRV